MRKLPRTRILLCIDAYYRAKTDAVAVIPYFLGDHDLPDKYCDRMAILATHLSWGDTRWAIRTSITIERVVWDYE